MNSIFDFIGNNSAIFVILSMSLNLIIIVLLILLNTTASSLRIKYKKLTRGTTGKNIERVLMDHVARVDTVEKKLTEIVTITDIINNRISFCIQKIGIVRYNAFEDTGSDLSYSIALLTESNDGIVLTGIHGRAETVSYAKPIANGVSSYNLSIEEMQALDRAKTYSIEKQEDRG
ncbi:MAG: DUF4446 family protein [Alkaliphilus sp.]